jgi:tetratricopeptide (TPR) repeat protein
MKKSLITLTLALLLSINLLGQDDKIRELVSQGTELHDQGKYDEAISKYKAALDIDMNSTMANYELSYTYMATGQYENAIKFSKKVLDQNTNNQHEAYIVLGSSLDMLGKPDKAIKAYEEGLTKFPESNLLNYNLALTLFNQKEYDKAENAAINAVLAKPTHGSSHIILSAIMQSKGERVKALLPLYYFLMLEPNSRRSTRNYNSLRNLLGQGVEMKSDKKINVTVPFSASKDSVFGAAEMMVSLIEASRYTEESKGKSDMESFIETNSKFFGILGELKKENKGIWWELYVPKFYDLIQTKNLEAFSYYISQSANSDTINTWIANNSDKMNQFKEWILK